ncbi:hypothetical protein GCM10023175_19960 [Pseudonocardia xishanensis]|uniref:HAD superfamily hydrolase (TIGR01490 family) n=1 Tax=Pseudonocardia xishanensis TaxID=630995 RepID=A0ABP8RNP6_9PSEU
MEARNGRYTGEIEFYCYGEQKAIVARRIATERGYDLARCSAYSDSITDEPLLAAVGHPTVVNPDKALRRLAGERGWPVRIFAAPVTLRARIRPQVPVLAGLLVAGGLAAAGGAGWWTRSRSRR